MHADTISRSRHSVKFIMTLGLISRMLLHFKAMLIEERFGVNMASYDLVFANLMLVGNFLGDILIYGMVPLFRKIKMSQGLDRLFKFMNNLINLGLVIIFACGLVVYFDIKGTSYISTRLFLLGYPIVALSLVRGVLVAFLVTRHGFLSGPKGAVARALVYTIYLYFIGNRYGLEGLMFIGNIATLSQVIIAYKTCKPHGYEYKPVLDLRDEYLYHGLLPMVLIIGSLLIYRLVPRPKYANNLMNYYLGWYIGAVMTVIFPILVEEHSKFDLGLSKTYEDFNRVFAHIIKYLMKVLLVFLIVLFINSTRIKSVFLKGGDPLPNLLVYYGLGLVAMVFLPLNIRALIAQWDFFSHLITVGLVSGLYMFFKSFLHRDLIPYAEDISFLIGLIISAYFLQKKTGVFKKEVFGKFLVDLIKTGFLTVLLGLVLNFIFSLLGPSRFLDDLMELFLISSISILFYYKVYNSFKGESNM